MSTAKSIMEITADEWLAALQITAAEAPDAVIVEGSWWRQQRTDWRLSYLKDVEELRFPDIFLGEWRGKGVAYCCAYGAPRAAEIIHLFSQIGAKLAIQIGTCGGLQPGLNPGDIIVPTVAIARDGVAHLYGSREGVMSDPLWSENARSAMLERGIDVHQGAHLTWSSIFAQDRRLIETWRRAGYLSVDMETATTFATASYFGVPALSMLAVWDDLIHGKSFLDPLAQDEQNALDASNQAVYEVALQLVEMIGTK
ncbi:MAG: hypothetical protein OXN94_11785 [Chloroflexota bacterium]|nr:hypothetical protein [Chloroflexota bacterium]